ncbi:DUF11 domain-containing protein [Streptomyces vinaceus]|uniref:DUF11 domain-containing protein n=1 Tax=Streptomyces vinaceus TaxID=1960 RepID=A0A5J6J0W9_STRVI|nr:DUF11 domain-containing protein [Streptomyces vinaceus]QEV44115.1 DUF11 domain-containing protein [Streptomyces vinaceus]GHE71780.1 hypothetical protein GCM10017778_66130 [Streptomyces vinaceus]
MTTRPGRRPAAWLLAALLCAAPLSGGPVSAAAAAAARPPEPVEVTVRHVRAPGDLITYTLTATNRGPSVARNVRATDRLPEGITFVESSDGCTETDRTVTCGPEPQLTVGQSKSWTFHARLSAAYEGDGSDLGNSATGSSDATDPAPDNNTPAPVLPPGPFTPVSDLATVKTPLGAGPTVPGQEFEYEIRTTNKGPSDARNVTVTDTLPDGLSYVGSADPCQVTTGRTVGCGPRARLTPGASVVWTFKVKLDPAYSGDGGDLRNTATSASASRDPEPADNTSRPVLPPGGVTAPQADVWMAKRPATTTPIAPGQTFDYVLTATNDGPSRAVDTTVTDALPAALSFVSSADGCSADGSTVTCGPLAVLDQGSPKSWRFTVRLDSDYTGNGSDVLNTATATSKTKDPKPENNTSSPAGLPGSKVNKPTADLAVTKEAVGSRPPRPGETFDYRIKVTNNGPSADAYNVKLTDNLPEGLSYVSSSPAGCTVSGHMVSCKRTSPLKVGDFTEYVLTVRVDPSYSGDGSDLKNTARVTADNIDPASENDSSTASVPGGNVAAPSADLSITKKPVQSAPVAPGETFEYALTVSNAGPSTAERINVSDALPTALSYVDGDPSCSSGRTVTCGPLPTLAPGADVTWVFRVKLDPNYTGNGSDIRNTATVSALTADPNGDNNTSRAAGPPGGTVKKPTADLEVGKTTP